MATYTSSMFDRIKDSLNKSQGGNSKYKDILRLTPPNVFTVRFIPNISDPEKTFWRYYTHAWESFSTGQYISAVSPTTWNDKDPIAEARYSLLKHGTAEEQERAKRILRRENWLANIYVVNDPLNPDNNGQVKLLRFGRQIHKIVMDAVQGDDSDEFGSKIFDLSENGCNFKLKAEKQGEFPTYVSSRFAGASKILDSDEIDDVHEKANDLESVFQVKSYDDLKVVLDEHFYCGMSSRTPDEVLSGRSPAPATAPATAPAVSVASDSSNVVDNVDPLDDQKVKELLDGLGD